MLWLALWCSAAAAVDGFTAESLQGMKFSALKRLASKQGIDDAQMDAALESPKPKAALVELLIPLADAAAPLGRTRAAVAVRSAAPLHKKWHPKRAAPTPKATHIPPHQTRSDRSSPSPSAQA